MYRSIEKWSRVVVVSTIALLPLLVYALWHIPIGSASSHEWLPKKRLERKQYDRFVLQFGDDQFLLITWQGCTRDDPRLQAFRQMLSEKDSATAYVARIESTQEVLQSLSESPINLTKKQASERLRGLMIGEDGTHLLRLRLTRNGMEHQRETIQTIHEAARQTPDLGIQRLRMAGTIFESYCIDRCTEDSLRTLVPPSCLLGAIIAWLCLRNILHAAIVLIVALVGQLLSIALVYYTRGEFSAILIVFPTLIFMLTLSGAIHLVNYYRRAAEEGLEHAGTRAMLIGLSPCLLSSVTTVIGMGSLISGQLETIQWFGIYCSLGLSIATLVLLMSFPQWIDWSTTFQEWVWPTRKRTTPKRGRRDDDSVVVLETPIDPRSFVSRYVSFVRTHSMSISLWGIVLLVLTTIGMFRLDASTKFIDMFPKQGKINQDMTWIEAHVGPISAVEVLLTFAEPSDADVVTRAIWVQRVSQRLQSLEMVGGVLSASTFLPTLPAPSPSSLSAIAKRSILRRTLNEKMKSLIERGVVANGENQQVWRVTAKVSVVSQESYGAIAKRISEAVREVTDIAPEEDELQIQFTGLYPLLHETQIALLKDLGTSFITSLLMIAPILVIVVRGLWSGILIMVPNVLPVTIVFGAMGWIGWPIDIAGILTASIALGIAVDDTLHFMSWYTRKREAGTEPIQAVVRSFQACGGSMLSTTLINCSVMIPFLASDFLPTRQFASLMIGMFSLALVGDFLLLPALLLSPLVKIFDTD